MAILRLANGADVPVKLTVADAIAAVQVISGSDGFIEMPTDDGPIHVRPQSILAILEEVTERRAGFRVTEG